MIFFRLGMGLVVLICTAPIFSVLISAIIAGAFGCSVDEGSAQSCVVNGADIGPTLYAMFVAGWLAFATFPVLVVAAIIWGAVELIRRFS